MSILQMAFEGGILLMQGLIGLLAVLVVVNVIALAGELICGQMIRRDFQGEKRGNEVQ